jgi:hypothetical protein
MKRIDEIKSQATGVWPEFILCLMIYDYAYTEYKVEQEDLKAIMQNY